MHNAPDPSSPDLEPLDARTDGLVDAATFLPRIYAGAVVALDLTWVIYLLTSGTTATPMARMERALVSFIAACAIFLVAIPLGSREHPGYSTFAWFHATLAPIVFVLVTAGTF